MIAFYNTTDLSGVQLDIEIEKAKTLDAEIIEVAKYLKIFSAWQMQSYLLPRWNGEKPQITSVRRSLHTLEFKKFLITKTGEKKIGKYGSPENIYTIKNYTL